MLAIVGAIPMFTLANLALLLTASSSSTATPTLPGGIITWFVCYRARRNQIGGWLLFFFWQMYGGLLVSAAFFSGNIQSYVPENFDSNEKFYMYLASVVPTLILYLAQLAIGTILLSVRTWDLLQLLRWVIAAEIATSFVGMAI